MTESLLVTDNPVYQSLSATYSEITGHPTPSELRGPVTTMAAPVTGTTETIPSSIASSELVVLPPSSSEALAPEIVLVLVTKAVTEAVDTTSTELPSEP